METQDAYFEAFSVHLEKPKIETFRIVEKAFDEIENDGERLRKFNQPVMPGSAG